MSQTFWKLFREIILCIDDKKSSLLISYSEVQVILSNLSFIMLQNSEFEHILSFRNIDEFSLNISGISVFN